jgi:membrane fusion protein (multidrug efflux system)
MSPPVKIAETHGGHAAAQDELGFDLPAPKSLSRGRVAVIGVAGIVVLGAAFVIGYLPRRHQREALAEATQAAESTTLRVEVVTPKVLTSDRAISLPGSIQPLEETILYARAAGFVHRWLADMGDKVKAGQVLAEIDTPELDQELQQAKAQLAQAQATVLQSKANRGLSRTNLERFQRLAPEGLASQSDLDQKKAQAEVDEANVTVSEASVSAQEANIRRLVQLKAFAKVTAPFDGTVTMRSIERGALVGNATPLYKVAALDPARVFVQVPQDVAPGVRTGIAAKVSLREYGGRTFDGTIAHAAGELDSQSRTMTTIVNVPNPRGELLPGMYATVALTLPSPHRVMEIPSTAILNDAKGMRVAVLGDDGKIHLVPIVVERDTGAAIEVASGLGETARVVKVASAQLAEGQSAEVAKPEAAPAK